MKFEIRRYYCRNSQSVAILDKGESVPPREISDKEAAEFMNLCEILEMKRHETEHQVFFTQVIDSHTSEEYIFYK